MEITPPPVIVDFIFPTSLACTKHPKTSRRRFRCNLDSLACLSPADAKLSCRSYLRQGPAVASSSPKRHLPNPPLAQPSPSQTCARSPPSPLPNLPSRLPTRPQPHGQQIYSLVQFIPATAAPPPSRALASPPLHLAIEPLCDPRLVRDIIASRLACTVLREPITRPRTCTCTHTPSSAYTCPPALLTRTDAGTPGHSLCPPPPLYAHCSCIIPIAFSLYQLY